jgi:hypothetical protein
MTARVPILYRDYHTIVHQRVPRVKILLWPIGLAGYPIPGYLGYLSLLNDANCLVVSTISGSLGSPLGS